MDQELIRELLKRRGKSQVGQITASWFDEMNQSEIDSVNRMAALKRSQTMLSREDAKAARDKRDRSPAWVIRGGTNSERAKAK